MSLKRAVETSSACVAIEGCTFSDQVANDLRALLQRRMPWMRVLSISVHRGHGVTISFKPTEKLWELNEVGVLRADDLCSKLRNWLNNLVTDETKISILSPFVRNVA